MAELTYRKGKMLEMIAFPEVDLKISIKGSASSGYIRSRVKNGQVILELGEDIWKHDDFPLTSIILDICVSRMSELVPMSCFYLPAARSGILQGHKALTAGIMRKAPLAGLERMRNPGILGSRL